MSNSNSNKDEAIELLLRDIEATIGKGFEEVVRTRAAELLRFLDDRAYYVEKLAEDVQQYFHDCRIDTAWPRCPLHPNHPLWLQQKHWVCSGAKAVIAPLGSLKDRSEHASFG
jgi:hypothetical protein